MVKSPPVVAIASALVESCPLLVTTKVCDTLAVVATDPKSSIEPLAGSSASAAGDRPVPLSVATAVPPGVAVTASVIALPLAAVVGLNVTPIAHEAPAASVAPQVLLAIANSAALVPDSMVARAVVVPAAAPPLLVTVNDSGALVVPVTVEGKVAALGLITSAAGGKPTPVKPDDAVPPGAAVTDKVALFCPALVGENVTVIVQFAAAANVIPLHPSVVMAISVESEIVVASAPVTAPPVLVTVKVTGVPRCPNNTDAKLWFAGSIVSAPGMTPLPCRVAVTAPPS